MPRKTPFSGKAKKQQLQDKRQRKPVFDVPGKAIITVGSFLSYLFKDFFT